MSTVGIGFHKLELNLALVDHYKEFYWLLDWKLNWYTWYSGIVDHAHKSQSTKKQILLIKTRVIQVSAAINGEELSSNLVDW